MRYVIDQMLANLAKELAAEGIDCITAQKAIRGNEDSSKSIHDAEIIQYMMKHKGEVTLITAEKDLPEHCRVLGLPCISVRDAVISAVKAGQRA